MKISLRILLSLLTVTLLSGCPGAVIVGGGTAVTAAHDRRTMGSFVEDTNIELKTYSAISKDKELKDSSHIAVTSYNGIVLLSGETPTAEMRARAESIARGIEKVRKVQNELVIASPASLSSASSDTWITTKVKTNLFKIKGHEDFDPTRVKVVTENGTVYLMGILRHDEADAVVNVVRNISGVQRVVKIFEYMD